MKTRLRLMFRRVMAETDGGALLKKKNEKKEKKLG